VADVALEQLPQLPAGRDLLRDDEVGVQGQVEDALRVVDVDLAAAHPGADVADEGAEHDDGAVRPSRAEIGRAESRVRSADRAICSAVVRALAANAGGDTLDRVFTTSSSAGFATLPRGRQNRMLDRGFRP
jgi:hypothetical protein